jgi:thiamine pyrophosphate-dependent acetolactate synthase large subunit-like protein
VVLDNERYGETGRQRTHTASGTDLAAVARACGFPQVRTIRAKHEIEGLRSDVQQIDDLLLAVVKVAVADDPLALPPRDGTYLKNRIRGAILGPDSILR